ncbi:MAG: hypothetical protein B7Z78_06210 [Rhodospirillales bacterium 20-60-12]|nr:MAG: hypothetical protein B7Z78_06210 [Rhodospirillales bacterium 20-60-12]HQT66573.1 DUF2252 family protein [Acetobacteraceae bacterium]
MAKSTPPDPAARASLLAATRNLKMARSPDSYVRGSTVKFYQWLAESGKKLPEGPPVWICGDCHIGNLGPLANAKGAVAVQIRDLDQTVIGNPAHDLVRLGLSLASAARSADLPGVATARIIEALIAGYEQALGGDYADDASAKAPKLVANLLAQSLQRRWRHLAEERLNDRSPSIPLGKRFWPLAADERAALVALFADEAVDVAVTGLRGREGREDIAFIDAAYWVKGCSSLGLLRYAVLLRLGGREFCLVDIKQATAPAAPRAADAAMPHNNAERVVAGARALSPHLGERMLATTLSGKPIFLRELTPQDLKLEIENFDHGQATAMAYYLANVVGRAHGRQMDDATRRSWTERLSRNRGKLDAPSWLWSSVVELLGIHEAEYLDHCRRYALAQA